MVSKLIRSTVMVWFATGCVDAPTNPTQADATDDELVTALATGKADGDTQAVFTAPGRLHLYGGAARQLYNLMDEASAIATTGNGYRLLRGPRTACITDGLATYCEATGATDPDPIDDFAAGIHGGTAGSAASYLLRLLRMRANTTASDVEVPWFRCVRTNRVWCGVERSRELALDFTALPPLSADFVYEGWIIDQGAITTDRFVASEHVRQQVPGSAADGSAFVLTVEPRRGDAPAPSDSHILAASLVDGMGTLATAHPAALGTDFASASARYVLATPTTAATDDNELGIWFVDPSGPEALVLPTLPAGWAYEGWVVVDGEALSTGRFLSGMGADSDGAGPTAGPLAGPPRPGQDFIAPPRDLVGARVVITVEPEPDDAATPFAIRPLIDDTVTAVAAPGTQELRNTSANRPTGSVALH